MNATERMVKSKPMEVEKTIERLVRGSIDMHTHFGPDSRMERRMNAMEVAQAAQASGMRAIVLKSHDYPTAPIARTVASLAPDVAILGSIALDEEVGGLNPEALKVSARIGARVVWMPTLTSDNDRKKLKSPKKGITIFDEDGAILPVVKEILSIIRHYDMCLATGHLSPKEVYALIDEARATGIDKIVVTHPTSGNLGARFDIEQQKELAAKGATMEYCFGECMPLSERLSPRRLVEAIKAVGFERSILSTDFGQAYNPPAPEGMHMIASAMLRYGLTEEQIEACIKKNPARLLGLD